MVRYPLCTFGEQARAELVKPLVSQLEDYRKHCQAWPYQEDNPRIIESSVGRVQLEGWLSGLRRPATQDGQTASMRVFSYCLGKSMWARINTGTFLRPWVEHVLSNATGISMQTIVIAQESSIAFASLTTLESPANCRGLAGCMATRLRRTAASGIKNRNEFFKNAIS